MAKELSNLFAANANLKDAYEVVRTVGFYASAQAKSGDIRPFHYRVEVILRVGQHKFQAILWTASTDRNELAAWVWEHNLIEDLAEDDPDVLLTKVIEFLERTTHKQAP
jgi:hypothetical protein